MSEVLAIFRHEALQIISIEGLSLDKLDTVQEAFLFYQTVRIDKFVYTGFINSLYFISRSRLGISSYYKLQV